MSVLRFGASRMQKKESKTRNGKSGSEFEKRRELDNLERDQITSWCTTSSFTKFNQESCLVSVCVLFVKCRCAPDFQSSYPPFFVWASLSPAWVSKTPSASLSFQDVLVMMISQWLPSHVRYSSSLIILMTCMRNRWWGTWRGRLWGPLSLNLNRIPFFPVTDPAWGFELNTQVMNR